MNITDAFNYARHELQTSAAKRKKVAGIYFQRGSSDDSFQLYELVYQEPMDEDEYPFLVHYLGGSLFSSAGSEETYSGDTIEEVLEELPDVAQQLNYHCFESDSILTGMTIEAALCQLFPQLPDPDSPQTDRSAFESAAVDLISQLGNNFHYSGTLN